VRIFVDEGAPMAQLLHEAAAGGTMPAYAGQLLAAFAGARQAPAGASPRAVSPAAAPTSEPLSQREMDVLRLFATELSGPEIAQELVIALSTVRTHTKSIYSKLNVTSRRAAVKRAAALGLL
jgi:LuxR family transcriptional regulator, maltose regulon positive regulatory protein